MWYAIVGGLFVIALFLFGLGLAKAAAKDPQNRKDE